MAQPTRRPPYHLGRRLLRASLSTNCAVVKSQTTPTEIDYAKAITAAAAAALREYAAGLLLLHFSCAGLQSLFLSLCVYALKLSRSPSARQAATSGE